MAARISRPLQTAALLLILVGMLPACVRPAPTLVASRTQTMTPFQPSDPTQGVPMQELTSVPVIDANQTSGITEQVFLTTPTIEGVSESPTPPNMVNVWFSPSVPTALRLVVNANPQVRLVETSEEAHFQLAESDLSDAESEWVYVLAAAFPTLIDGVSGEDLRRFWQGDISDLFQDRRIMVSDSTLAAFSSRWGEPAPDRVAVVSSQSMLELAWKNRNDWAIISFEELDPRWKVLQVDGISPFDEQFDPAQYPLTMGYRWTGKVENQNIPLDFVLLPKTNRDAEKMTSLVMTGVTALVRATAVKMEKNGMTYPAKDIRDWLLNADLTHISNEVSFEPTCPDPNAYQTSLMFCSKPEYIALLDDIDADVIELSGNHLVDWRRDSLLYTFELYRQRGMQFYAAGENLELAREPLLVEDHGNRLAFIGCNPAGPETVWATEDRAGAADCDYEWMYGEVSQLREGGYLPIVTLQYNETYSMIATPYEQRDFDPFIEAGAVIVSGSQSHFPQAMKFINDGFIHYGLGNLFFDQMDTPVKGTRREFIDRHIFYDGRYIGVEILTAMLEEYARPRPMTEEERMLLLQEVFETSGW